MLSCLLESWVFSLASAAVARPRLVMESHRLEWLLTGALKPPLETVIGDNGEVSDNDAFEDFVAQDNALTPWLLFTISSHILSQFVSVESAAAVWTTVQQLFANRSTTIVMSFAVSHVGHVVSILKGLPREYQPFMVVITTMKETLSLDSLYTVLFYAEAQLAGFDEQLDLLPMSVNVAQRQEDHNFIEGDRHDSKISQSFLVTRYGSRGWGRARIQCQICGKLGHLVNRCWHRYEDFMMLSRNNQPQTNVVSKAADHGLCVSPLTHDLTKRSAMFVMSLLKKFMRGEENGGLYTFTLGFQSNWGSEYRVLSLVLAKSGIVHRLSCPHTLEQNGVVESKHRHIVELGLVLLAQASLPIRYWSYAVVTIVQLVNQLPTTNHTLSFRSQPCTYLGFSPQHKGYQCIASDSRVYISRHVVFNEMVFPFVDKAMTSSKHHSPRVLSQAIPIVADIRNWPSSVALDGIVGSIHGEGDNEAMCQSQLHVPDQQGSTPLIAEEVTTEETTYTSMNASVNSVMPLSMAIQEEYDALQKNNTWTLVKLPVRRIPVGCKWLFKLKRNHDGSIQRYKECLVAKGFSQVSGYDFNDTFTPVVKFSSFNVVLALAVANGWELRHVDINNAFLNGDLDEDIFMQQPLGFEQTAKDETPLVRKLKKHSRFSSLCVSYATRLSLQCWEGGIVYACTTRNAYAYTFVDADWGANIDDRRSIYGYGVFVGRSLVTWSSNKHKSVSMSTMEAEYKCIADTTAKVTWVSILLTNLGLQQPQEPVVWCDNAGAVAMSTNSIYHAQSKHIDLNVHFVQKKQDSVVHGFKSKQESLNKLLKRIDAPDLKFTLYFMGYEDVSTAPSDPIDRTAWTVLKPATIELNHLMFPTTNGVPKATPSSKDTTLEIQIL
ncbi:hypothetical protein F3Y22_tig00110234pilonHSYRG00057 [Hibiscus syriacus]|uniref:Uncharacterized protein n=1 Tax=Hibiscus syriacus TaxID=106335 RepID=A0A6A3B6E1_HIBSY|nr:hypothetical protein F3Y22_tig00110234pilonHSYRG00057 [Hibiscus syriacus]